MTTVTTPAHLPPQAMEPIAVIGLGCLFPQADNPHQFWTNIKTGVDAITEVPESHWRPADYFDADPKAADRVYAKMGGFLSPVQFNPMDYGILPNALEATDSSQLLGLLTVDQALKDAGYATGKAFDRDRVSVILGVTGTLELVIPLGARLGHPHWRKALQDAGVTADVAADVMARIADSYVPWQENSFPGLLGNVVAGRISKHFDFGGTNCVVDAACGSSLSALNLAALELAAGRSDMVISGGVDTFNDIFMYTCFSKTPALSPGGHAKPYADDADGTTLGEGLGVVVLKRLADAKRDGDRIYAVVKGIGASSDGRGAAIYEPDADGQCLALRRAYEQAQVSPETIELIEGHGTGTKVGDAIEVAALHRVFGTADKPWCALGSIKSQIGHTKAAAGAAGLIKATLALYHKVLPPTIKVHQPPASLLSATTPFYVNTTARPWLSAANHPRRAGVSALGFGGSNFHCLLEEYQPAKQQVDWPGDVQIVPLCGPDRAAIKKQLQSLPYAGDWNELRAFATRQRSCFDHLASCRLLLVVEQQKTDRPAQFRNAVKLLASQGEGIQETPDGIFFDEHSTQRKIAFLYPGQGAQYPFMLKELALHFPEFLAAIDEADRVFSDHTQMPRKTLADLIYPRPLRDEQQVAAATAALRATEIAQPALGAVTVAATAVLGHFNIRPAACAGHSYGELVALATAGVFSSENLHRLSRVRGELMAAGDADRGTMLAVSAPLEEIAAFIEEEQLNLVLANRNTPRQGVLSGARAQIEKAHKLLRQRGLSATPLTVSAAFHSTLVADATEPFARQLTAVDCSAAAIPVYSNTLAQTYPQHPQRIRHLLAHQLANPVNFVDVIKAMHDDGIDTFIEVGPGARLTGMVKAILTGSSVQTIALDASAGKRSGMTDLARLVARIAASGIDVTLTRWDENFALPEVSTDGKKRLSVTLSGANYFNKPQARPPKKPVSQGVPTDAPVLPHGSGNTPMTTSDQQNNRPSASPQTPQAQTLSADTSAATEALRLTQQNIEALQTMQQQTAKLHQQFLEGQQATTRSFMTLIEQQRQHFAGSAAQAPTLQEPSSVASRTTTASAPAAPNVVEHPTETMQAAQSDLQTPTPTKTEAKTPKAASDQVTTVLLEVIAEKTGYPVEMLELGMSLDADLGIDSIKRVEILSALQERLPELPAVRPEDLSVLQTLGQIVEHLQGSSEQPTTTASTLSPAAPRAATSVASDQVTTVLLEVIAEKTGYPVEMLELGMSLDADLGIDSIKRVEILSALQERLPELPAIKPEHLGTLQTIAQIVDFLTSVSGTDAGEKVDRPDQDSVTPSVTRQELKLVALPKQRTRKAFQFRAGSEVWLTDDGSELMSALCSELTAANVIPRKIKIADLDSLDIPDSLSGLLIVAPLKGTDELFVRESFRLLKKVSAALQAAAEQGGAFFATISRLNGCFGLPGRNPVNDPVSGGLAGLSKTAALEWPAVHCKALDLDQDLGQGMEVAPTARLIVDEIFIATPREVGITSTGLQTLDLVNVPLTTQNPEAPAKSGELIVISGGARGVTAAVAIALAQHCQPVLALLGRSPLPEEEPEWLRFLSDEAAIKKELLRRADTDLSPRELQQQTDRILAAREIRTTLERILKTGATPLYSSVDVCDGAALSSIISELEQLHGPVQGIIHGAGVLADRRIVDKTPDQFAKVYATKVSGCRHLLAAIDPEKLRFLVMFSSSTGRFGRVGQVDYAVANEVLNKLAQQHRQNYPECHVLSLNWGPWDGGMVTPALKKLFVREGIDVIDLKAGADYLVQELSSPQVPGVELVISGGNRDDLSLPEPEVHQNLYVSRAFDLDLDIDQFPFLQSHVIDGKAVLPVAIMIEWLAHAAIHSNPGLKFQGLNDLRVLKGVVLESDKPCTVQAMTGKAIKSDGLHVVPVELSSTDHQGRQVAHVRARVVLAGRYGDAGSPKISLDLPEYPHTTASIYQSRRLFHGKDFQGIREVTGCASEGIGALVAAAPPPADWIAQPLRNSWFADPLVLDSSFQLLILWSFEMYRAGSLPVFIDRYRQYQERFPASGVEIRVEILEQTSHRAISNIDFVDPVSGALVARLEKYECVIDASLNATFQRNRLIGVA